MRANAERIKARMEKFLSFWSHNNALIIEVLVALILVSTIYLVYRLFFGAKSMEAEGAAGAHSVQIEKTLQKILEQQAARPAGALAGETPQDLLLELSTMKSTLEEKDRQILVLQEKASVAAKEAQDPNAGPSAEAIAAAAQAAAGLAEKERSDYEAKIKELESRLAEYEIISEDIADLSFFKEENVRLTKELESLRSGDSGASAEAGNSIDDSLMAEFAKAVEGQKSALTEESKKSDNDSLVSEFENLNKKS